MTDTKVDHRKVYARGYYDAMRRMGLNNEAVNMNTSKFELIYRGLNSAAKKVYDATPIAEAWSAGQIGSEMRRTGTGGNEFRVIEGCLGTLVDLGIAIEPMKGVFSRTPLREKKIVEAKTINQKVDMTLHTAPEPAHPHIVATVATVATVGPIEKLSVLAKRLRDLAGDMETAALELAEQAEKNNADTAKMRQLQALLKSLG